MPVKFCSMIEDYSGKQFGIKHAVVIDIARPWWTFDVQFYEPFAVYDCSKPAPFQSAGKKELTENELEQLITTEIQASYLIEEDDREEEEIRETVTSLHEGQTRTEVRKESGGGKERRREGAEEGRSGGGKERGRRKDIQTAMGEANRQKSQDEGEERSDEGKVVCYVRRRCNAFAVASLQPSLVASLIVQSHLSPSFEAPRPQGFRFPRRSSRLRLSL